MSAQPKPAATQADRRKFIGGSDAAAILGISPWRTPLDIFLDKSQPRIEEVSPERQRVFTRGHRMEPYVVDLLAEETGLVIVGRNNRYIDKEFDFLACEIDAEAATGENIEIKTVSPFKAKEWGEEQTDAIPVHYTAQAMHGLMITGKLVCVFGVLIGGDDFRVYRVERDEEIITAMRAREVEFWRNHIEAGLPPEPTTASDVIGMFSKDSGLSVEATHEIVDALNQLRDAKAVIKEHEPIVEELEARLKLFMRDAAVLTVAGNPMATWKSQTSSRFDQSAFKVAHPDLFEQFKKTGESRVFRLK